MREMTLDIGDVTTDQGKRLIEAMELREPATKADAEDLRRLIKQLDRHVSELAAAIVRLLENAKEVANA